MIVSYFLISKIRLTESILIQSISSFALLKSLLRHTYSVTYGPKKSNMSWTKFFWYKTLLLLSSTYWHFSLGKLLKRFLQWIQSYEDVSFLGPKWSTCLKQFFWKKSLISFLSTYWPLLLCKIFKKFLQQIQSSEDGLVLEPK